MILEDTQLTIYKNIKSGKFRSSLPYYGKEEFEAIEIFISGEASITIQSDMLIEEKEFFNEVIDFSIDNLEINEIPKDVYSEKFVEVVMEVAQYFVFESEVNG